MKKHAYFKIFLLIAIFLIAGCIRVTKLDSNGRIVSQTDYYPFSKQRDIKKWDGITPLHLAVINDDSSKVKQLLMQGADPFAKAVSPTTGKKIDAIDMAYTLHHDEALNVLADYILKNKRDYLDSHPSELINVLSAVWEDDPLYSLELSSKYGYNKWANHILKKLFNTREYLGKEGKVHLAKELMKFGYDDALKVLDNHCHSCVEEAKQEQEQEANAFRSVISSAFSSGSSDNSKSFNCNSALSKCKSHCNSKSDRGGMLSNSAKTTCNLFCQSGYRKCQVGNYYKAKFDMCSGMCQGLKETSDALIFGTSNYDQCVTNCTADFK